MAADGPPQLEEIQRSSRDPEQVRVALEAWLADELPPGAAPSVGDVAGTSATGMSSETLLFTAEWQEADGRTQHQLVARIAPSKADVPVFPSYDMRQQFEAIRLVGELTHVPVPRVLWCDDDGDRLGAPAFVMERVEGIVPPDLMPYTFGDSWVFHADEGDRVRMQDDVVGVLAELHTLPGDDPRFAFLAASEPGESPLRRHVAHRRAWYDYVVADSGLRSPLIEATFDWLEAHWPETEGDPVVSWGDSRIGNMLFADFETVAVLDWEMVGLGPRELDVSWLVYAHRIFHDMAVGFGMPGMPGFLRQQDVVARYEQLTGTRLAHLDWYAVYAALAYAIVFLRTGQRSVHFGEREMPADVDDIIFHRADLERMLAGTYPWELS